MTKSKAKYRLMILEKRIQQLSEIKWFMLNTVEFPDRESKDCVSNIINFLDDILNNEAAAAECFLSEGE